MIRLTTPLTDGVLARLRVGDKVELNGVLYTGRDAAHKRLVEAAQRGERLPIDLQGQVIYYVGPTPPRPGMVIGSAGPTTSIRMDPYVEPLLKLGLKGCIGKGYRTRPVVEALKKYRAVYFVATGGAGALLAKRIKRAEVIAYEDLGTEAIRKLWMEAFPVIVGNDIYGNDVYQEGVKKFEVV